MSLVIPHGMIFNVCKIPSLMQTRFRFSVFHVDVNRLLELCHQLQEEGWRRISHDELGPRAEPPPSTCCFKAWLVAPNGTFTGTRIFRQLLESLVSCVVAETNQAFIAAHHGPKPCKLRTTSEEVWAFIAFLLRVMAERKPEERALIRSEEFRTWSLLSQKKCEFLSSHLMCSYDSLIPAFNEGLRSIIQVRLTTNRGIS